MMLQPSQWASGFPAMGAAAAAVGGIRGADLPQDHQLRLLLLLQQQQQQQQLQQQQPQQPHQPHQQHQQQQQQQQHDARAMPAFVQSPTLHEQQQQHMQLMGRLQQLQRQQLQLQQQSSSFGEHGLAAAPALFAPCSTADAGRPALAPSAATTAARPDLHVGGIGASLASLGPASGTPTAPAYPSPLLSRPVAAQPSLPGSMLVQHLRQVSAAAAAASAPIVVVAPDGPHGPHGPAASSAPSLAPSAPDLQAHQRFAVPCAGGEAASHPSCSNSRRSSSEDLLTVGSKRARGVFEGPSSSSSPSTSCLATMAARHSFLEPARHAFADERFRLGQQQQQGFLSTAAAAAAPHMGLAAQAALAPLAPSAAKAPRKSAITSKYRGVSWHKRDCRWFARLWVDNKIKYLGSFQSEERAALAVDEQEIAHKGSLARRLNFPDAAERQRLKDSFRQEDAERQARSKEAERLAIAEKAARAKLRAAEPFLGGVLRDISLTSPAARSPKEEADDEQAKAEPKAEPKTDD